jgi:DNA-binding LacI/PurR family transcriptional regulator
MGFQANPHAQRLATGRVERTVPIFSLYLDLGSSTQKLQALQCELQKRGYDAPLHAYGNFDPYHPVEQVGLMAKLCCQRPPAIVCHPGPSGHVAQIDEICRELGEPAGSDSWWPHFRAAMEECELPIRSEWLWSGSGRERGGALLGEIFLALPEHPSGLVIIDDHSVAGFIGALWKKQLQVPQEVSVIGHDDSDLAEYFPVPITTISGSIQSTATAVVDLVVSRLERSYSGPPREVVVQKDLICRASTGPAP